MRRVDLNLLYILRELLKEPNTTKVGDKLGLTQSAVSASLGRLRWAFQDELFVRSGRAMAPTKKAEGLLEPVEDIIQRIENLVEEVRFEPENLQRNFTLCTSDFLIERVAAPIIAEVSSGAPNTRVIFNSITADTRDRMRSGHLDLLIAPYIGGFREQGLLSFQALYTDHLVVAVWEGSKNYGDQITQEELLEAKHTDFNPPIAGGWKSTIQEFLDQQEFRLNAIAELSTMTGLIYSLKNSDVMAIMPNKLVELLGKDAEVRAMDLPFDMKEFEVGMCWNRSFDNDPEHQWFREMVEKALADI